MTHTSMQTMTSAQAREHMNAALDGELAADAQTAFERALAADADLREEYEDLSRLLADTRSLGAKPALASVDLLAGVQQRLRERSGGKFYRDRFAEARGQKRGPTYQTWMLALALIVVIAVGAWLAFDAGIFAPVRVNP